MRNPWQYYVLMASMMLTSCALAPNIPKAEWKHAEGLTKAKTGEYTKAEANYNEALTLLSKVNDARSEVLRANVAADLGKLYMRENRYQESKSKFEAAVTMYDKAISTNANKLFSQYSKAGCLADYAILLRAMQQPEKAAQLETQAKDIRASIEKPAPAFNSIQNIAFLVLVVFGAIVFSGTIALVLAASNCMLLACWFARFDLAIARTIRRLLLRKDFGVSQHSRCALAIQAVNDGRFLDAQALLTTTENSSGLPKNMPPINTAVGFAGLVNQLETTLLATAYTKTGQKEKALPLLEKIQQLAEDCYKADPSNANAGMLATAESDVGVFFGELGEYERGIQSLERSLELRKKLFGNESKQVGKTLNNFGDLKQQRGDLKGAEENLLLARRIAEKKDQLTLGFVCNNLASVWLDLGKTQEAYEISKRSLKVSSPDRPGQALRFYTTGRCLEQLGQTPEALRYYKMAIQIWSKMQSFKHPAVEDCKKRFNSLNNKILG